MTELQRQFQKEKNVSFDEISINGIHLEYINWLESKIQALNIRDVTSRLKALQTLKNNPDLLLIMGEFKRAHFGASYIMEHQIETEEELASVWLSQLEAQLFRLNGL